MSRRIDRHTCREGIRPVPCDERCPSGSVIEGDVVNADLSPSASSIIRALQQENKILKAERDRYHRALDAIAFGLQDRPDLVARAALDGEMS